MHNCDANCNHDPEIEYFKENDEYLRGILVAEIETKFNRSCDGGHYEYDQLYLLKSGKFKAFHRVAETSNWQNGWNY